MGSRRGKELAYGSTTRLCRQIWLPHISVCAQRADGGCSIGAVLMCRRLSVRLTHPGSAQPARLLPRRLFRFR